MMSPSALAYVSPQPNGYDRIPASSGKPEDIPIAWDKIFRAAHLSAVQSE